MHGQQNIKIIHLILPQRRWGKRFSPSDLSQLMTLHGITSQKTLISATRLASLKTCTRENTSGFIYLISRKDVLYLPHEWFVVLKQRACQHLHTVLITIHLAPIWPSGELLNMYGITYSYKWSGYKVWVADTSPLVVLTLAQRSILSDRNKWTELLSNKQRWMI